MRWIVQWQEKMRTELREEIERERRISRDWRDVAETEQNNNARTNQILGYVLDNQRRMLALLEQPRQGDTGPPAGWPGSRDYDSSRTGRHASMRPP